MFVKARRLVTGLWEEHIYLRVHSCLQGGFPGSHFSSHQLACARILLPVPWPHCVLLNRLLPPQELPVSIKSQTELPPKQLDYKPV